MNALLILALARQGTFVHHKTQEYTKLDYHGFTIRISPEAMQHQDTTEPALELAQKAIDEFCKLVPKKAVATLKKAPIWMEQMNPGNPSCCFHESKEWLRQNGYNTDKAPGVEISNTVNYVKWTHLNQPYQLFHEFSHAYHSIKFGFENARIKAAYDHAIASHKYDMVDYNLGGKKRAYALNNQMEYFAELSEAYFGINDFQPFKRADLKTFDPEGFAMIEWAWKQ